MYKICEILRKIPIVAIATQMIERKPKILNLLGLRKSKVIRLQLTTVNSFLNNLQVTKLKQTRNKI